MFLAVASEAGSILHGLEERVWGVGYGDWFLDVVRSLYPIKPPTPHEYNGTTFGGGWGGGSLGAGD